MGESGVITIEVITGYLMSSSSAGYRSHRLMISRHASPTQRISGSADMMVLQALVHDIMHYEAHCCTYLTAQSLQTVAVQKVQLDSDRRDGARAPSQTNSTKGRERSGNESFILCNAVAVDADEYSSDGRR